MRFPVLYKSLRSNYYKTTKTPTPNKSGYDNILFTCPQNLILSTVNKHLKSDFDKTCYVISFCPFLSL